MRNQHIAAAQKNGHIRILCKLIFYLGVGNFWYEEVEQSKIGRIFYDVSFFLILNIFVPISISMGIPVFFDPDFTIDEKTDSLSFVFGHLTVVFKWWGMMYYRGVIKDLLKKLNDQSLITDDQKTAELQARKFKINITLFALGVCSTVSFYTVLGITRWMDGKPYFTTISFWPPKPDVSLIAQLLRVAHQLLAWVYVVVVMVVLDGLVLAMVIQLCLKFITLRKYFEEMSAWFEDNKGLVPQEQLELEFKTKFVTALKFHSHVLKCVTLTQQCTGLSFTMTVSQIGFLVALCLSRFMETEHDFANLLSTGAFLNVLLGMLVIFMWNCGDLNLEASYIPYAIFKSGWDQCWYSRREVKSLVLLGSLHGQTPVYLTAYGGVMRMSHAGIVAVVKTSYSMFAVFY